MRVMQKRLCSNSFSKQSSAALSPDSSPAQSDVPCPAPLRTLSTAAPAARCPSSRRPPTMAQSPDSDDPIVASCQEIQRLLKSVTTAANGLPVADFPFLSTFRTFDEHMKRRRNQILSMIADLMRNHTSHARSFLKASDDQQRFDILCDFNDYLLDKVGNSLDDAEGLKKKNEALIVATLHMSKRLGDDSQKPIYRDIRLLASKIVERPQNSFAEKPDNSHDPFIPKITDKPNSLKPLAVLPEIVDGGMISYGHPYEFEIERFEPDEQDLRPVQSVPPVPLESSPLHMIESRADLTLLMQKLKASREIAVDLEHHNYRSFQGFTCLIQISTRTEDFIIDALKLRSQLNVLNEVFTDPKIVKVFHGADHDVMWLQKDFGVYLVNLFDTFHASKTLGLVHNSLAYLLKLYCSIEADKQYQLSDWRIRPLEDEMVKYARQDTHYLLYIYDLMRNDLLSKGNASQNLLRSVIGKSSLVCLKKYEKPVLDKDSHLLLINKTSLVLNNRQMHALEQVHRWRDRIAREEDESTAYILPNHMLLQLAQILPREVQGILACCQPTPPAVKQNLNELHLIFLKSRELPLNVIRDKKRQSMPILQNSSNIEIHAGHDVGHDVEPQFCLVEENPNPFIPEVERKRRTESLLARFLAKEKIVTVINEMPFTTPYDRLLKSLKHPVSAGEDAASDVTMQEAAEQGVEMESNEKTNKRSTEEMMEFIRSIRHKEAVQVPEAAAVTPHEYRASDMQAFEPSRKSGAGKSGAGKSGAGKKRFRDRKNKGANRKQEAEALSYRYTVPNDK